MQTAGAILKWIPGRSFPISQREDLFGAFDGIAVQKGKPIEFYQATIGKADAINKRKRKVEEVAKSFPQGVLFFVWTRPGRGRMVSEQFYPERNLWE